jgi:hypothetical protein
MWLGVLVLHVRVRRGLRLIDVSLFASHERFQVDEWGGRGGEGGSLEL